MGGLFSPATFARTVTHFSAKVRVAACARAMHSAAMDPIDEECLSGYRPSSYYPAKLGDVINQSYAVKVKLGFGRTQLHGSALIMSTTF